MKIKKIQKKVKKMLDTKRYEHSIGVAYTACALAMRYECSIEDAYIAGICHDCAKNISSKDSIKLCKSKNINISEVELNNPFLLHGKAGAVIANKKFKINNEDIICAISNHTTGRPGMSLLEKIIFVADYIEPNRKMISGLEEIRKLAFIDLDKAIIIIIENTLNYLTNKNAVIDSTTQKTYDYYVKGV